MNLAGDVETTECHPTTSARTTPQGQLPMVGTLLVPLAFSDHDLLMTEIHGFKSTYQLKSAIEEGQPRWISNKEAMALLCNAKMFAIDVVEEEQKRNGLVCVINSESCSLPQRIVGYGVKNNESIEKYIGQTKVKKVEMDRHEVRGKNWARRRLFLHTGDHVYHVLQWKQFSASLNQSKEASSSNSEGVAGLASMPSTVPQIQQGEGKRVVRQAHAGRAQQPEEPPLATMADIQELASSFKHIVEEVFMAIGERIGALEAKVDQVHSRMAQHLIRALPLRDSSVSVTQALLPPSPEYCLKPILLICLYGFICY